MITRRDVVKLSDYLWEIPKTFRDDSLDKLGINMRVPARIYASEELLDDMFGDRSLEQLINVATLPGIQKYAIVMPDAHEGYGFPIGGVAAFLVKDGVISPGGIGYDINCGVRLLRSSLTFADIRPHVETLGREIYKEVPSGVGQGGRLRLNPHELDKVLAEGAERMVAMGYGEKEDLTHIESNGRLPEAAPHLVSKTAKERGRDQLGTMGAGNHFVEVQRVETIFDEETAHDLGLFVGQVTVMIHTGSRGLGHQIATDYIRIMMNAMPTYKITVPDRELACAPFQSQEGQEYFHAMSAGANFAWANRQLITHEVREAWRSTLGREHELAIVYDVAHNIAKVENNLVVHRKGATRAFPNQPVLIPGSMGTSSYVLMGQEKALTESFGSSCHGAGRVMSRAEAKRKIRGTELKDQLSKHGIVVNTGSLPGLAEEAPEAYKNVDEVVEVIHQAGIATKVARLRPLAVIKG